MSQNLSSATVMIGPLTVNMDLLCRMKSTDQDPHCFHKRVQKLFKNYLHDALFSLNAY